MPKYTPRYFVRKLLRPSTVAYGDVRLALPEKLDPVLRRQIYRETFEAEEIRLLRQTVRRGDRILDLGAGIGLTSIVGACLSGETVVAIEALPEMAAAIRRNAELNRADVEIVSAAVGVNAGEATFHVDRLFVFSSLEPADDAERITVPVAGIRDLIDRYQPSYLNVDIEGAEFDVLPLVTRKDVRCISVEVHDDARVPHLVNTLRNNGFELSPEFSRGAQMFFT